MKPWTVIALIFLTVALISFFITAGILYLICWAFSMTWWSWKACFGIWLIMFLLGSIFRSSVSVKK